MAAMVERENGSSFMGRISALEEAVLGGRHVWACGSFCCRSGEVTDEIIAEYMAHQNDTQDEDFRVDG
jgi:REP element-mobilizing transposase RayT